MTIPKKERKIWAERVLTSLLATTSPGDHIVFLAGKKYREYLLKELTQ